MYFNINSNETQRDLHSKYWRIVPRELKYFTNTFQTSFKVRLSRWYKGIGKKALVAALVSLMDLNSASHSEIQHFHILWINNYT